MAGFGRTGKWFACDNWDVVPDILTVAKGINSGYVPLGAMIARGEIVAEGSPRELIEQVVQQCDGVRCDMAMLLLPDIIERVWGNRLATDWNRKSFWKEASRVLVNIAAGVRECARQLTRPLRKRGFSPSRGRLRWNGDPTRSV